MQDIESDIMDTVLSARARFDIDSFGDDDVLHALDEVASEGDLSEPGFAALLSPAAKPHLEEIATLAKRVTRAHFGNSVAIFTPLYLANYCQSNCIYCGFSYVNKIKRVQLDDSEITHELEAISQSGMQEILLLTGEAPRKSTPEYIASAAKIASQNFANVGVEVYPMDVDGYRLLQDNGVDYVTVFQETYDRERYKLLHLSGEKRNFSYRFNAQERALLGGMRGVAFAALLGIADFRKDAFATGLHAKLVQRKFPHAAISLSCPRLRPATGNNAFIEGAIIAGKNERSSEDKLLNPNNTVIHAGDVSEADLLQVICAYRLLLPFANITVSTRESEVFRDNAIKICATKVSAGVDTGIGRHSGEEDGDAQFEIADTRTFSEMVDAIKRAGQQPVVNEHIRMQ
ncbi:MAG: 2-iminoacetate synthase [Candidatus Ancillula sp.]|jgi:2-iminoacetate synthase|nr:2-iminoacetate synthase [Candidatus Ancillula sp.]